MCTLEFVVYGRPSIGILKRMGYMDKRGKSKYIYFWDNVAVWFGQSCIRVRYDLTSAKSTPTQSDLKEHIESIIQLCFLQDIQSTKVMLNKLQILKFMTLDSLLEKKSENSSKYEKLIKEVENYFNFDNKLKELNECYD